MIREGYHDYDTCLLLGSDDAETDDVRLIRKEDYLALINFWDKRQDPEKPAFWED